MIDYDGPLFFLVAGVAAEIAGGGKLAKLVTNHIFGYVNGDEFVTVVNSESMAYEVRRNHGSAAPGLDYRLLAGLVHGSDFLFELDTDEGSFF